MILPWLLLLLPIGSDPDSSPFVAALKEAYLARTPLALAYEGNLEQARDHARQFVDALVPHLGPVVGYKAALTNPAARARMGVDRPLLGALLEKMLVRDGAVVPVGFGAQAFMEGDLVVRVGSEAINRATTRGEAMAALDAVFPFMECPDLVFGPGVPLTGPAILAINAGARLGVLGEAVPVTDPDVWVDRIAEIRVVLEDGQGNRLVEGVSAALMGHPLDAVLWIRDEVRSLGKTLRKGDLLSLGSITALVRVAGPGKFVARYEGLVPEKIVSAGIELVDDAGQAGKPR